jgi:hypothetical protein
MLSADHTVWEETINKTDSIQPFTSKEVLYIQDQNSGGSYAGQIQFDCSSLANNQRWLNYQEAYLEIPFQIDFKSSVDITAAGVNAYTAGLKNGYYQIIDSMQVDLNNQNIVQLQNNLNMLVNYKVLTSFSQDDLDKLGPSIGVGPDTAESYTFSATTSVNGDGYCNNRNIREAEIQEYDIRSYNNAGLYNRQKYTTAISPIAANQTDALPTTSNGTTGESIYRAEGANYMTADTGVGAARVYSWVILATIRLKDICDWFDKVPLMKGANYRFTINYNSCKTEISASHTNVAGPPSTDSVIMVTASHIQLSGHSNPVIFASGADFSAGYSTIIAIPATGATVTSTFTVASGVVGTSLNSGVKSIYNSCRLYVPAYKLDPTYELNLIQTRPTTTIKYLDYYTYSINGTSKGASFNSILTNGIINPKAVIVIPYVNAGSASAVNVLNLPTYQSLFDSAPGTTSPACSITNFQVQIAGENVFQSNQIYSYSQFLDEFQHLFAVNGSNTTSINSGLISQHMWRNAFRFYCADLSRRLRHEDKIPKSVMISGTNNTNVTVDYICFILFEKEVTIKTASGEVV